MQAILRSAMCGAALLASTLVATASWGAGFTEPVTMENAIKGTMDITFNTRTTEDDTGEVPEGSPALGATDEYAVKLEIVDSVLLQGIVRRLPWLPSDFLGVTEQEGYIEYDLRWILRNPQNPSQTVTLGGWVGAMMLDGGGKYHLAEAPEGKGKLRNAIDPFGNIPGFVSEFAGEIQGRVPEQAGLIGLADRASSKVTKTYTRYVDGKVEQTTVEGADPMSFDNATLGQGPIAGYAAAKLNGSVDYDPEEGVWYVDLTASYSAEGTAIKDRFSGTIRWNEDPNRMNNGIGWYEVNVRVNEKAPSEEEIFQASSAATSEDAFFAVDTAVPGFTGRVSYVDTFEDETVVASKVAYSIAGNSITKAQAMVFAKLLMLMVGPFNDE
jgi:hypothetical protein